MDQAIIGIFNTGASMPVHGLLTTEVWADDAPSLMASRKE